MRHRSLSSLLLAAGMLVAACGAEVETTASGEDSSARGGASLRGETIELVVGYEPGGGYDTYARLLAPYLEECLRATVVVRNEPGAGGLLASSQTFVAPSESLRTELMNTVGVISAELAEAEGASFEAGQFTWLGRVSAEPNVLVVASDSRFNTFQDLVDSTRQVRLVATGPGSNEFVNSTVLPEVYGFPAETVTGFEGSEEARAAVLSGDADAHVLPLDSQMDAIESGDVRPLLVIDHRPHEALPDVPTVADIPPPAGQQVTLDALIELAKAGRTLAGPPRMQADHATALREGLSCALRNPDLLTEVKRQGRYVDALSGLKTAQVVDLALDAPPQFVELVQQNP